MSLDYSFQQKCVLVKEVCAVCASDGDDIFDDKQEIDMEKYHMVLERLCESDEWKYFKTLPSPKGLKILLGSILHQVETRSYTFECPREGEQWEQFVECTNFIKQHVDISINEEIETSHGSEQSDGACEDPIVPHTDYSLMWTTPLSIFGNLIPHREDHERDYEEVEEDAEKEEIKEVKKKEEVEAFPPPPPKVQATNIEMKEECSVKMEEYKLELKRLQIAQLKTKETCSVPECWCRLTRSELLHHHISLADFCPACAHPLALHPERQFETRKY